MLVAQHYLGSAMVVRSDEEQAQWNDACLLCQWELGYGAGTASTQMKVCKRISGITLKSLSRWLQHVTCLLQEGDMNEERTLY